MKIAEATITFDARPDIKVGGEVKAFAQLEVNGEKFEGVSLGNGTYARLASRPNGKFDITLFHESPERDISGLKVSVTGGGVSRIKEAGGENLETDNAKKLDHESITFGDEFFTKFRQQIEGGKVPLPSDPPVKKDVDQGPPTLSTEVLPPPKVDVPKPSWQPPVSKSGMSKLISNLTTSKQTRTQEKTEAGLEGLKQTTTDLLKMLSGLPKGSLKAAAGMPHFKDYFTNLRTSSEAATKRGVDFSTAFQGSVKDQIKTLSTKELNGLAELMASSGSDGELHSAELVAIRHSVVAEIKDRQSGLNSEALKWSASVRQTIEVHEGTARGPVKDGDERTYELTGTPQSSSNAIRGLVACFNRAIMGEPDPDKARALVAKVVGGLGTDGRKVFLEALLENFPSNLPLIKGALKEGGYPPLLDPDGTIQKGLDNLRNTVDEHVAGARERLIGHTVELLDGFGQDDSGDPVPPKSAASHPGEIVAGVIGFQTLLDEYVRVGKEFGTKLPEDFETFREHVTQRLGKLVGELATQDQPLKGIEATTLAKLEKTLARLEITTLNDAITAEQTEQRKELEGRYVAKLETGIRAGVAGNFDGLVKGMLGLTDLRNRTVETALALSSNTKFANFTDGGKSVDLLGAFADPTLNVAIRNLYVSQALDGANLSLEDMILLQKNIQEHLPLVALLIVGASGTRPDDVAYGRVTAEWLVTMDQLLSAKTGIAPMKTDEQTIRLRTEPDAFFGSLPPVDKQLFEDNMGYTLGQDHTVKVREDLPLEKVLEKMRD